MNASLVQLYWNIFLTTINNFKVKLCAEVLWILIFVSFKHANFHMHEREKSEMNKHRHTATMVHFITLQICRAEPLTKICLGFPKSFNKFVKKNEWNLFLSHKMQKKKQNKKWRKRNIHGTLSWMLQWNSFGECTSLNLFYQADFSICLL